MLHKRPWFSPVASELQGVSKVRSDFYSLKLTAFSIILLTQFVKKRPSTP